MSKFTAFCKQQAQGAWAAAAKWPAEYSKLRAERRRTESTTSKVGGGCLGFLLFGFLVFFIPLLLGAAIEAVVLAWGLLWTLLWVLGAGVDRVRPRH